MLESAELLALVLAVEEEAEKDEETAVNADLILRAPEKARCFFQLKLIGKQLLLLQLFSQLLLFPQPLLPHPILLGLVL